MARKTPEINSRRDSAYGSRLKILEIWKLHECATRILRMKGASRQYKCPKDEKNSYNSAFHICFFVFVQYSKWRRNTFNHMMFSVVTPHLHAILPNRKYTQNSKYTQNNRPFRRDSRSTKPFWRMIAVAFLINCIGCNHGPRGGRRGMFCRPEG